ncbi:MAG: hypothetical protein ABFD81_08650 [Syntrophaceae bacterium]
MFRRRRIVEAGKHDDLGSIERNFLPAALEIQETPPSVIPAKAGIQVSPVPASSPSHSLSPGVPAKRVLGRAGERGANFSPSESSSGHPEPFVPQDKLREGSHSNVGWVERSATHQPIETSSLSDLLEKTINYGKEMGYAGSTHT